VAFLDFTPAGDAEPRPRGRAHRTRTASDLMTVSVRPRRFRSRHPDERVDAGYRAPRAVCFTRPTRRRDVPCSRRGGDEVPHEFQTASPHGAVERGATSAGAEANWKGNAGRHAPNFGRRPIGAARERGHRGALPGRSRDTGAVSVGMRCTDPHVWTGRGACSTGPRTLPAARIGAWGTLVIPCPAWQRRDADLYKGTYRFAVRGIRRG